MSKTLRDLRIEKGVLQSAVADELDVSIGTVSAWEKGHREPSPTTFPKLAKYFRVTTEAVRLAVEESKARKAQRELAVAGKE